jgi:hypothetical protein
MVTFLLSCELMSRKLQARKSIMPITNIYDVRTSYELYK